jgi:hypothetical protein
MKDFDRVFFEFSDKKNHNLILTKEAFYKYTIQIAADRLGFCIRQKEMAEASKKWFAESYEDYLLSKHLKDNNFFI